MAGPSKAEIWLIELKDARGHEQKEIRPALVWKDPDHVGMAVIIPFTKNLERESLLTLSAYLLT